MVDRENHDLFDGLKKILYEDLCSSYPYNMERYMIPSKLLSQTSGAGKKITYKNFKEYASIKSDSEDRKPEYARTLDPYAYLIGIRNFKFQPWVKIPTFQVKD